LSKDKQDRLKQSFTSVTRRHHFATPNTVEIIFSLLFIGIIYRVLSFLGRD